VRSQRAILRVDAEFYARLAKENRVKAMRIATFNILNGRSPTDDVVDERRFRDAIVSLDADLLGLQEVDRRQPRSRYADLTAIAADAMVAPHHMFVPAIAGTPGTGWSAASGEEAPDTAAYGIAFLSRRPVTDWTVVRLPAAPLPVPYRATGAAVPRLVRDEPRVAIVASVDMPHGPMDVVTTHLSFLRPWADRQLRRLVRTLSPNRGPTVLIGDLNMPLDAAQRMTGMNPLAVGPTFPAAAPRRQIDHILTDGQFTVTSCGAVQLAISDHRALVADLAVSKGEVC
jgi:endonuclease/exonuclease/phosphatase family metal-dependent hydrolase